MSLSVPPALRNTLCTRRAARNLDHLDLDIRAHLAHTPIIHLGQPVWEPLLKGKVMPVPVWPVLGIREEFGERWEGCETPLIGRDREMSLLLEAWVRAQGGEGQLPQARILEQLRLLEEALAIFRRLRIHPVTSTSPRMPEPLHRCACAAVGDSSSAGRHARRGHLRPRR